MRAIRLVTALCIVGVLITSALAQDGDRPRTERPEGDRPRPEGERRPVESERGREHRPEADQRPGKVNPENRLHHLELAHRHLREAGANDLAEQVERQMNHERELLRQRRPEAGREADRPRVEDDRPQVHPEGERPRVEPARPEGDRPQPRPEAREGERREPVERAAPAPGDARDRELEQKVRRLEEQVEQLRRELNSRDRR